MAFTKVLVITVSFFLIGLSSSREISSATLNKLEKLIEYYKDTIKTDSSTETMQSSKLEAMVKPKKGHATEEKIPNIVINVATAERCGVSCRKAYEGCLSPAKTFEQQLHCASIFLKCYPLCFFGDSLKEGDKDVSVCEGTCLWNADRCMMSSSKVEMFVCMGGRKQCYSNCPSSSLHSDILNDASSLESSLSKRGNLKLKIMTKTQCNSHCQGLFDLCYGHTAGFGEQIICFRTKRSCKRKHRC